MAIFVLTNQTVQAAMGVVTQADDLSDKAYALIDVASVAIDDAPKVLRSLKKGIQGLIAFNNNAITALRNNPIARGPWRILVLLVVGILRGFGGVLRGLKAAVTSLINFLRSSAIKRLKKKLAELREQLIKYTVISDKLKEVSMYLYSLAAFLETQQIPLEKKYPSLKPSVRDNQLKQVKDTLVELQKLLTDINASIDDITDKVDAIKALLDSINTVTSLISSVVNAINSVLGVVNQIFKKIKDFISSIPGIGWLLGSMNKVIDWVLDKLGIKSLLSAIGASLKNLPFIKAVFDFLDDIKARVEALISAIITIIAHIVNEITKNDKMKQLSHTIITIFSQLNLKKIVQEFYIPEWVSSLLEQAKEAKEKASNEGASLETTKSDYDAITKGIYHVATLTNLVPDIPIETEVEPEIKKELTSLISSIEPEEKILNVEDYINKFTIIETHLSRISKLYDKVQSPEFDSEYFKEGIDLYKQLPEIFNRNEINMQIDDFLKNNDL